MQSIRAKYYQTENIIFMDRTSSSSEKDRRMIRTGARKVMIFKKRINRNLVMICQIALNAGQWQAKAEWPLHQVNLRPIKLKSRRLFVLTKLLEKKDLEV